MSIWFVICSTMKNSQRAVMSEQRVKNVATSDCIKLEFKCFEAFRTASRNFPRFDRRRAKPEHGALLTHVLRLSQFLHINTTEASFCLSSPAWMSPLPTSALTY
jgi:hypothetical protein